MILKTPEINTAVTPGDYLMLANEEWGDGIRQLPNSLNDALSFTVDFDRVQALLNEDYSKTRISCRISDLPFDRGMQIREDILLAGHKLFGENIDINVDLFTGNRSFTAFTMDFTKNYIEINADYRS